MLKFSPRETHSCISQAALTESWQSWRKMTIYQFSQSHITVKETWCFYGRISKIVNSSGKEDSTHSLLTYSGRKAVHQFPEQCFWKFVTKITFLNVHNLSLIPGEFLSVLHVLLHPLIKHSVHNVNTMQLAIYKRWQLTASLDLYSVSLLKYFLLVLKSVLGIWFLPAIKIHIKLL